MLLLPHHPHQLHLSPTLQKPSRSPLSQNSVNAVYLLHHSLPLLHLHPVPAESVTEATDQSDLLCEHSDTNAQISERSECVISNYEAKANDLMTSALGKIHEEVLPSFQQRSMDFVNLALHESKAVADREWHKTSLRLDERQRQLDQCQGDLELNQRQMELMQQQRIKDVVTVKQPPKASGQQTLLFQTVLADLT